MDSAFRADLFAGRSVLVTGGGSGIGFAIAQAFARHGAETAILSRNEARLQAAATALAGPGRPRAAYHVADVRDRERIEQVAKECFAKRGPDIVVNSAAGNFPVPFAAMGPKAWDAVLDIVLDGTANVCRSFGLRMAEAAAADRAGGPRVVLNVVAGYAWTGAPGVSHSGAAKAGVLNLTKSLAVEWAPHVRVNAVSPGPIGGTEGMKRLGEDLGLGDVVRRSVPLGRLGTPDEVAQACLFLASPAASYVTGACLVVDGGQDAVGPFGALFQAMQG